MSISAEDFAALDAKVTAILNYLWYTCPATGRCREGAPCNLCRQVISQNLLNSKFKAS